MTLSLVDDRFHKCLHIFSYPWKKSTKIPSFHDYGNRISEMWEKPFKEMRRTLSILTLSSSCGKNVKSLKYTKSTLLYSIKGRETEAEG